MDLAAVAYILVFLLSIAFLYDQITKRIPSRLHPHQAPKSRFELVPVRADGLPIRANGVESVQSSVCCGRLGLLNRSSIIFVHGLGSNPDTTWRAARPPATADAPEEAVSDSNRFVNWVSDFLPDDFLPATHRDVRMFYYNYDSYWKRDAVHTRLANLGNALLEHIRDIRASETVSIGNRVNPGLPLTAPVPGAKPGPHLRRIQLRGSGSQAGRLAGGSLKRWT